MNVRTLHAILACLITLAAAPAAAQRARVEITVEGLFGEGTLLQDGYLPVLVTVESRTRVPLSGELELTLASYEGDIARHRARLDLPPRATRQIVMTLFTHSSGTHLNASFETDQQVEGETTGGVDYSPGGRSIVVFGDPPRLRGALLDLDVNEFFDSGPRQVRVPIGSVRFDPASGDPMLPSDASGWATVKVLAVSAPMLSRIEARERRAIADWLRTGGRMLVFPRTENDLGDPWLRQLVGRVDAERLASPGVAAPLEAPGVERFALSCRGEQRSETFGCSRAFGFGRVFVASYDATTPAAIETGAPRELLRAVYAAQDDIRPVHAWGREGDSTQSYYTVGFSVLRAALDPNENFRPALLIVALVLLLYVIVVGPINFTWVQRKNRPALALITTPAAAVVCLLVLLMVGYLGKGVQMRYRRFELVDLVEGQARAPARRYTGLFSTRPGSFDLPAHAGAAYRIDGGGADRGPAFDHEGARVRMSDFRAGLWETIFLREDRLVELGGPIHFVRDDRRLAYVVNESAWDLQAAFIIDAAGSVYRVGDVRRGGRVAIPRSAASMIAPNPYDATIQAEEVGRVIGIGEEEVPYLRGLFADAATRLVAGQLPTFYARVPLRRESIAGTFAREVDYRWIRVVPSMRGARVEVAPPVIDPAASTYTGYDAGVPDAGVDGGADDQESPTPPSTEFPSRSREGLGEGARGAVADDPPLDPLPQAGGVRAQEVTP